MAFNVGKLHDEAYALKILCLIVDKYVVKVEDQLKIIMFFAASLENSIPGRHVYRSFLEVERMPFSDDDEKIVQEIISIYS